MSGHTPGPAIWLVYSREHNAWWRPKAAGYTNHIEGAGRYTAEEAERHCRSRDFADPDEPPEVACIAPETAEINADLLEALEFYAAEGSWTWDIAPDPAGTPIPDTAPTDIDRGAKARAAIARASHEDGESSDG